MKKFKGVAMERILRQFVCFFSCVLWLCCGFSANAGSEIDLTPYKEVFAYMEEHLKEYEDRAMKVYTQSTELSKRYHTPAPPNLAKEIRNYFNLMKECLNQFQKNKCEDCLRAFIWYLQTIEFIDHCNQVNLYMQSEEYGRSAKELSRLGYDIGNDSYHKALKQESEKSMAALNYANYFFKVCKTKR